MIGGWMWISKWVKEIERKHEKNKAQKEDFRSRHLRSEVEGQMLRRIKLAADEKQRLRAKINEQEHKITHSSKKLPGYGMKMAIYFYMAIMILGAVASALIIFIYGDISYTPEAVKSLLSCLIIIVFCVLWLVLSSIREGRSWPATIPGVMLFILGSGTIGLGVLLWHPARVIVTLVLGVPILAASYLLCFSKSVNIES